MPQMLRRLSTFVILIAALTALEPLLHNHPLQQTGIPDACAICATGTAPVPSASPSVAAPQVVVYTLAVFATTVVTAANALTLASRAPPSQ
jgi:hypothetical protein